MSQFGAYADAQNYRKRIGNPGVSPPGLVVTPNAPGLIVDDSPSVGALAFYALARGMGLLTQTAGEVGQARAIAQSNDEQALRNLNVAADEEGRRLYRRDLEEANSQERIDAMAEAEAKAQFGLGREQGQSVFLRAREDAANGRLDLATNPEESVDAYLAQNTQGLDPDQAEGIKAYRKDLIELAYKQRGVQTEAAKTQLFGSLASAVEGGKDPAEIKSNLWAFNITPQEFDRVLLSAAEIKARKGQDPAEITAQLSDQNLYAAELASINAAGAKARDGFERQAIDQMRNQLGLLEIDNVPLETRIAAAETFRGKVPNAVLGAELTQLRAQKDRMIREAETQIKDSWRATNKAAVSQQVRSMVKAGTAASVADLHYTDPWTGQQSYSRNEILTPVMREEFAAIAQSEPNPQLALAKQSYLADTNGYIPPEWKQAMDAGGAASSFARLATQGGKDLTPPASLKSGYELWRTLSAANPAFLAKMGIDRRANDFYEAVDARGGDDAAFLEASRVTERWKPLAPEVEREVDTEAVAQIDGFAWFNTPVENKGDVSTAVAEEAKRLMRLGRDKETALEKATATLKADTHVVNGRAVLVNDPRIGAEARANFPAIAGRFIDHYAQGPGKDAALAPDRISIDYRKDGYILIDRDTLEMVPGPVDDIVITPGEIAREWSAMSSEEPKGQILSEWSRTRPAVLKGARREAEATARQRRNATPELNSMLGITGDPNR